VASQYKIDPAVLHKVAKQVVGLPLEGGELLTQAVHLLVDEYPDLIDPTPGCWVGSKAGGILGKVRFLYFSPREIYRHLRISDWDTRLFGSLQARADPQDSDGGPNRLV
jgi:ERG2 and Sigma1 receptor like protein